MRRFSCALAILSLFAAGVASAADTPLSPERAEALRVRFQTRQRETRTWTAGFTQTLTLPGLPRPVISTGTMAFRAPDQLRIDFSKPAGEWVLVSAGQLFVKKPGKSVSEKSLTGDNAGKPFRSLLGMLRGQAMEEESQYDSSVVKSGTEYLITLQRRAGAGGRLPRQITNTVSAETLEVERVAVELPNGGTLTYQFDSPRRNQSLPADLFTLPR